MTKKAKMTKRMQQVTVCGWLLAACGNPASDGSVDASSSRADAEIPVCLEESLQIGRCEVVATGEQCQGLLEESVFLPVQDGDTIPIVIGPQGAQMLVLSLRTTGIAPGDIDNPASTDRPDVAISLVRNDVEEMARYTGRPTFHDTGGTPENQDAFGVFVLFETGVGNNETIRIVALLEDSNSEHRCGNLDFIPAAPTSLTPR